MRRLLLMVMLTAVLIPVTPTLVAAAGDPAVTSRVTIQLDGASVHEALLCLFRGRPESHVFQGVPANEQAQRLFLTLNNVEFESAVRVICEAAELDYRITEGVWMFSPRRPAAYLHGASIPILFMVVMTRATAGLPCRARHAAGSRKESKRTWLRTSLQRG